MLSTQMMKLAGQNQWKSNPDEQTIFGEFNGYLFTGLEGKGFKAFITPLAGISPDSLQTLLSFLEKNARVLRLRNFDISDNFLCVRQQEGLIPLTAEKMEYLLAQVSGLLDLGEMPTGVCAVCGKPAPRKGLYYGLYCNLHPECQDREPINFTGTAAFNTISETSDSAPETSDSAPETSDSAPETSQVSDAAAEEKS